MNYELLSVLIFRYFYMSIAVIDMYLHAHHYCTETVGEGRESSQLTYRCKHAP